MAILLEDEYRGQRAPERRTPVLVFSGTAIAARGKELATIATTEGVDLLLAVKATPDVAALPILAPWVQGYDVSNAMEFAAIAPYSQGKTVSLTGPVCGIHATEVSGQRADSTTIVNVETDSQLMALGEATHSAIVGVRLRATHSSMPASADPPFGFDEATLESILQRDPPLRRSIQAVHVHGGGRGNTIDIVCARAASCLKTARKLGLELAYANYGGGYDGFSPTEFQRCLRKLVDLTGRDIRVLVEPGEYFYSGCGWAEATVVDVAAGCGGARAILDVSSEAHLRWSKRELPAAESEAGACAVTFVGPTCFRGDVLGQRWIKPSPGRPHGIRAGDRVRITDITSYSPAWNVSFNGVPKADILIIDTE